MDNGAQSVAMDFDTPPVRSRIMVLARDRTGRIQVRSTLIQATGKRPHGVTTNTNQASISKSH